MEMLDYDQNKPQIKETVQTVTEVSCVLSILGSLLIIITFFAWRDLRTKARQIVVFLSVADFITAVGYLYGSIRLFKGTTWDCIAQSAVTTFGNISSFLWTISIAIYIYMLIVKSDQNYGGQFMIGLHVVNWGIPLIIVSAALATDGLGWDASYISVGWCWVNLDNHDFLLWMLLGGKIWEVSAYIILPIIYCLVKRHIFLQTRHYENLSTDQQVIVGQMLRVDLKLTLIPIIFILLRMWSTVRFVLYLTNSPAVTNTALICLHGVGNTFQGAANCILFCFFTEKIRRRLFSVCCCCCTCCPSREVPVDMGEEDVWHERSGLLAR